MQKIKIEDHMLLSQQDRQLHIDLTTDCQYHTYVKDYGTKKTGDLYSPRISMDEAKRRLLDFHNIENFGGEHTVHTCHKCANGSNSDKVCVNPLHLTFGTASENESDKPLEIRQKGGKSNYENGTGLFGMSDQEKFEARSKGGTKSGTKAAENGTTPFHQIKECPHCKKEMNLGNLKKYHLNKCKFKK